MANSPLLRMVEPGGIASSMLLLCVSEGTGQVIVVDWGRLASFSYRRFGICALEEE